ncbi:DNA-binding transcriptional regulator, Lrp family [Nocardia amikacinitolerans]|uniref:Lrp/AsnC family transcriptional regulator n=1 Tax=Nocardia amikacinitolerans TaxID=756689 RepID=UPI0009FD4EC1|nr:DNA-binding transcriptional regulator, Lrp family [Nocardia amikacinitolerans]
MNTFESNRIRYREPVTRKDSPIPPPQAPPRRSRTPVPLDDIDRVLLDELARDGRMTNNALAAAAGIAPSTCLGRVRALVERGVIRGFHADIDPSALGRGLQAMIAVRLHGNSRKHLAEFGRRLAALAEVLNVYFIAGADDYLIHVATENTDELRGFVLEHLSANPAVSSTETILIFEHLRPQTPVH